MPGTSSLLVWYARHRRRLPWRDKPTPYRVWVSEIMLQQTQVAAVLPYYRRFLRRFPSLRALASASEPEVLKHWAGLGYYSRARNLLAAARQVVRDHRGRLPSEAEALLALPGIGRYTAGAIASIAFGKPAPLVDGNVARVLSRLYAVRGKPKSVRFQERVWKIAEQALARSSPGDWNQALMELGALVCVPENPRCAECPLSRRCLARKRGLQERLPERGKKRTPVGLQWRALWIENGSPSRVLLWRRDEQERFLPGQWSLPEPRHLGAAAEALSRLGSVRHAITHHRITVDVWRARLTSPAPRGSRWIPRRSMNDRLVSSLWRKAAAVCL